MRKWIGAIGILIILVLLFFIVREINFHEAYYLVSHVNIYWFIAAIIATALTFILWAFGCMYIFRPFIRRKGYKKGDFWFFLKATISRVFFNQVTPGAGVGGEPFKAHYLAKRFKKSRMQMLTIIAADSFFRMVALGLFVLFSILFVFFFVSVNNELRMILEGILVFVILISVLLGFFILKKFDFKIGILFKKLYYFKFVKKRFKTAEDFAIYVDKRLNSLSGIFREIVTSKKNIVVDLIIASVFWITNIFIAYFLFLGFGEVVNFFAVLIVFIISHVLARITPFPGGVAVTEGAMILLYSAMGFSASLAVLVTLLQRIIYYFFSLIIGGFMALHMQKRISGMKYGFF